VEVRIDKIKIRLSEKGKTKMKTLNAFLYPLYAISIAFIIGCNDSLTSSSSLNEFKTASMETGWDSYSTTIQLDPHGTVFLDSTVTSLSWIGSYVITNCEMSSRYLFISASNLDNIQSLPCNWRTDNSFMLKDLHIRNLTSATAEIDIKLAGIGVK